MSLLVGDVLRDRYRILRILKAGGMGAVFQAQDLHLDGLCAVKEMREELAMGKDPAWAIRHFQQEAQLLSQLHHPGVPKVRDFFIEGANCFVIMDYVEGDNLEEEVEEHGPFPPEKVKSDALQVLEILEYLHGLEPPVMHRDIKPSNLIRQKDSGRVMLVDFGLARPTSSSVATMTSAGTVNYCPPEQLRGKAEPRSDLYSLGATMVHLLSGEAPAFGDIQVPMVDRNMALVIGKATLARPEDRFKTATAMREALQSERPLPPPPSPRSAKRAGYALAALALASGLCAAWLGRSSAPVSRAYDDPPELVQLQPCDTLCCREDVKLDQLAARYAAMLGTVQDYARTRQVGLTGANYSRYLVWDPPRQINVEVGCVLAPGQSSVTAPKGPVYPGALPGGQAVRMVHHGAYDSLSASYWQMQLWLGQQGLKASGTPWAYYRVTGENEALPARWVTELYCPVKR